MFSFLKNVSYNDVCKFSQICINAFLLSLFQISQDNVIMCQVSASSCRRQDSFPVIDNISLHVLRHFLAYLTFERRTHYLKTIVVWLYLNIFGNGLTWLKTVFICVKEGVPIFGDMPYITCMSSIAWVMCLVCLDMQTFVTHVETCCV